MPTCEVWALAEGWVWVLVHAWDQHCPHLTGVQVGGSL